MKKFNDYVFYVAKQMPPLTNLNGHKVISGKRLTSLQTKSTNKASAMSSEYLYMLKNIFGRHVLFGAIDNLFLTSSGVLFGFQSQCELVY